MMHNVGKVDSWTLIWGKMFIKARYVVLGSQAMCQALGFLEKSSGDGSTRSWLQQLTKPLQDEVIGQK